MPRSTVGAMNAPDTNPDAKLANDIWTAPRSAGTKMSDDSHASAAMIASQRETAGANGGIVSSAGPGAAEWLSLAAAPTFATMALLARVIGARRPDMFCSVEDASLLSGMVPMYLLMSAFHLPPWLKLISCRRDDAERS